MTVDHVEQFPPVAALAEAQFEAFHELQFTALNELQFPPVAALVEEQFPGVVAKAEQLEVL